MKAAVFYGKNDLRIEDIEMPKIISDDTVIVKVRACGICGTDVHIFEGDEGAAPTPRGTVLGHEFAGEVVGIGSGVTSVKIGDRVAIDPNELCGRCDYCRNGIGHFCQSMTGYGTTKNGGFAEYCAVPESQVYKFSDKIDFSLAAMAEPVACCLHGIDMCDISAADTVAIIGGGMIGLIMLSLAKLRGASKLVMIEPIAKKRSKALELGADVAIDPFDGDIKENLRKNGCGRISTVIECVGKVESMKTAIDIAGKKSTVMLFGLTAPSDTMEIRPFELFKKEITLKASFINPYTQSRALALIENGRIDIDSMIYDRIRLDGLTNILSDAKKRALGKYIVAFED